MMHLDEEYNENEGGRIITTRQQFYLLMENLR